MNALAYYNHGRWMINCPRCGAPHVVFGETVVCAQCWPQLFATKFETDRFGALVQVPHVDLIRETQMQAIAAGECYEPVYPDERHEIERILRGRQIPNMNWMPGETVQQLLDENAAHGVED